MGLDQAVTFISAKDYLYGELLAENKHELVDGQVYAMAGGIENHNLLSLNMATELKNQLKGKPCKTFMADMKVKAGLDFYYPDVMVVCQEDKESEYYKNSPLIIVLENQILSSESPN